MEKYLSQTEKDPKETMGQVRVGSIITKENKTHHPEYKGFTPIVVMTASSHYGHLGPYVLKDTEGRIMENIWQFSKVYGKVPAASEYFSKWDKKIIWSHPCETHIDGTTKEPNELYWAWRKKGEENAYPVRYPVGYKHRQSCLYSLAGDKSSGPQRHLSYIEARKAIYVPMYSELVKNQSDFTKLQNRLKKGENLLILEVDGPHQETLGYYQQVYSVGEDFIENNTTLATKGNLEIFLNDKMHPFGHGYCLAAALLDIHLDLNVDDEKAKQLTCKKIKIEEVVDR